MKFMHQKKWMIITPLILFIILFFTGAGKSDLLRKIARSQKRLNDVYKYLVLNYVDEIDIDKFTSETIHNIVSEMDPYTVFMEESEQDGLKLLTNGSYGGVGIQIGKQDGELTVIAPMEDSPASRAGILSGDVIVKIDSLETEGMTLNKASSLIRGPRGSKVVLTIRRRHLDTPLVFSLTRDKIVINDVALAEEVEPGLLYIRLTRFSRNAPAEMKSALQALVNSRTQGIILDLRDNPGGLLKSAIDILDYFIPKGETLLYTKGRVRNANRSYLSEHDPIVPERVKVAVLINGGSASASEIVAGAIQDLDRGLIIGQTSFGKGLVQSVIDVDSRSALKITTAKYYIPSGRLIQKPGYIEKDLIEPDSTGKDTLFTTSNGRPVKGGGGITPDERVEGKRVPLLTQSVWREGLLFDFVRDHREDYASFAAVQQDSSRLVDQFVAFIQSDSIDIPLPGEQEAREGLQKLREDPALRSRADSLLQELNRNIGKREHSLFREERGDLQLAVLQEFARQMEGAKGRIRFSLPRDPIFRRAATLLTNEAAYNRFLVAKGE
ncbi:MAG: S41 family peptidase [Candidatus Neomarinimicrobiota bacterium]|nr:MAG: S41 family peptidase [Candidatus Neomarinimicrobiota bacterium]